MYSRIAGTGSYFPAQIRSNADLEKMVDTTDDWIMERTGIKERRISAEHENVAYMGARAAEKALEMAGLKKEDIDMIVMGTTSNHVDLPSGACYVQKYLDMPYVPAFDVAAACSGFIYSLSIADQYIRSGMAKRILVIGADALSHMCDPKDRSTIILFGDAAGAVVLEASEEQGIISTHLHADGNYGALLGANSPKRGDPLTEEKAYIYMKGNEVFKFAVTRLSEIVTETLEHNNMDKSDIDWLVPHQANLRIIAAAAKKLSLPMSQVVVTLDKHGNTSAATIPTALDEAVRDGRIKRGQTVLMEAFGSGFTWGSALIRF
ncbi:MULTISPECIES: beta-ketoacyl-ACP synthase III [unclassified Thalassotalea]|uniref:beta-ketoacyl-ACP synthase III n=1 Tax=unclassified Thalassotalea TaxID=2614972 RepID=UPI001080A177|nr:MULTISPECIES: beta-ketoacyl-ACP synthase III [unclassified Thalassotalea]NMP15564.1 ketoacyl-ACP synthase III [Thalassotalea sp. Y01]QBY05791.1 ketoacyl-ACP synthase III [Thalassotalea sp. HSM 43]